MKLLIFGLPGSGKTTLSKQLAEILSWKHLNADIIRRHFDDWDFSKKGRIRQATRMFRMGDNHENCIVDFVCPYAHYRSDYDFTIFMDTIDAGRYEDTNSIFERSTADIIITDFNYDINSIISQITSRTK